MPNDNSNEYQVVKVMNDVLTSMATTNVGVVELRSEVKDMDRDLRSRVDNLDRSHQELRLTLEKDKESRDLLISLLQEEREERRQMTAQDRSTNQEVRKEAREDLKEQQAWMKAAFQALWDRGGQWLVLGLVLVILALLNQQLDLGLPFFDLVTGGKTTVSAPAVPQTPGGGS